MRISRSLIFPDPAGNELTSSLKPIWMPTPGRMRFTSIKPVRIASRLVEI